MTSENLQEECFSQGDKSDVELDLMSLVQDDSKDDVIVVEEETCESKTNSHVDNKTEELLPDSTPKPVKPITIVTPEIYKANRLPPQSADLNPLAKPSKPNQQRKSNNRYRSNKKSSFKSNKTNNVDNVDKWKHDKFEMIYGDSNSTANIDVFTGTDNATGSNVEEIKDCIVNKLHSLTLSKSENDKKSTSITYKAEDANTHVPRKYRDSNNHKNYKPTLSVVVTDNTKKAGDKKSPTCTSPVQLNNFDSPKGTDARNRSNQARPLVTYASYKVTSPPFNQAQNNASNKSNKIVNKSTVVKEKSTVTSTATIQPHTTDKKYFESSSTSMNQSNNTTLTDPMTYQPQTVYPTDPTYYPDQSYYYYTNAPYYPTNATDMAMSNLPYQPNVYFHPGYATNVYYHESGVPPQFPYYNNPQMYNEAMYYQPPMEAYFSPDQQFYDNSQSNYRWTGGRTNHPSRASRRH